MRVRPPSPWAIVLSGLLGTGLAMVLIVGYVNRVDRAAEARNVERSRDICGIIRLIDDRNQGVTPTTEEQKQFIDELHRYRLKLRC